MKKIILVVIIVLTLLLIIGYLLNDLSKSRSFQFFGNLVTKINTNEKVVALTFDDGPGPNTEAILKVLDEEDVKATFFLIGNEIDKNRGLTTKIIQNGHEIGNHSYSHQRMVFRSYSHIKDEIEKTDKIIRELGYKGDIYFRPPNGKKLLFLPYYLHKNNRYTILWDIEPESYKEINNDSSKIANYVVEKVQPGSIILLHVMYENREKSLKAIKPIIVSLKEKGYKFVTISELLELNID